MSCSRFEEVWGVLHVPFASEIQKGMGARGRDRKCHNCRNASLICRKLLGRLVCRTKPPPKNVRTLPYCTKKGLKTRKKIRKTIRNVFEQVLPLSGRLKIFHRNFSTNFKSFSPPKICTKKCFFSPRGSAGVATLINCRAVLVKRPKRTPNPRTARTAQKNFPKNSRGLPNKTRVLRQIAHQKVHPNVRQNLCATFSLGYLAFLSLHDL